MKLSKLSILLPLTLVAFSLGTYSHVAAADGIKSKRVIVKFSENENDLSTESQRRFLRAQKVSNYLARKAKHLKRTALESDVFEIEGMADSDIQEVINRLNSMAGVLYAEEDKLMQHQLQPNDTLYSNQWHYFDSGTSINVEPAWDKATGNGVVVAVLDTGYLAHGDLAANILPGYDMISDSFIANDGDGRDSNALDPGDATAANECGFGYPASSSSWHGTHVAGTIAAVTDNNSGVAGVAFDAQILPVRVLGKCGGYTSDITDGIIWAAGGSVSGVPTNTTPAQVINLSLGGSGSCSQSYVAAISSARANGATIVIAAGNSGINASNAVPANCADIISVAATGPTGASAYYTNYGNVVDVAAPGGDLSFGTSSGVYSTLNTGTGSPVSDTYAYYQGTSMAAPHVAGIAALLYEADPSATLDEIEAAIVASAAAFPGTCSQCGSGIADASAAIDELLDTNDDGGGDDGDFEPVTFSVNIPDLSRRSWAHYTLDVESGASTLSVDISGGTGDADLYIRYGAQPTLGNWDYRPYLNGNNESVTVSSPQAGTWYISVRAYRATTGVTLSGSVN
ncbi:MAG: S8 family peptidase [Paraglaciecola sp.]|uniref:S8 family peptidase n=1 Tax=Paraglaciecola sp. TaxID=1920173 RepID=UPI003299A0DF